MDSRTTVIHDLLREFGTSSSAYHTLQAGLEYWLEPSIGYIAYKRTNSLVFGRKLITVVGNPVCERRHLESLLRDFLENHPGAAFYLIDFEVAAALSRIGYYVNEFGVETILKPPFELIGSRRSEIRLLLNRARAANVEVRELNRRERRERGIQDSDIEELTRSWLSTRPLSRSEFTLLSRGYEFDDEPDCRKFYATCENKLVGVGVFDPIYRDGQIEAYVEVVARAARQAPKGTRDILLFAALEKLAVEKIKYVSLGLSPLEGVREITPETVNLRRSKFTTNGLDFTYRRLNGALFNFRGLCFKKNRYMRSMDCRRSTTKKIYCGFPTRYPIAEMARAGCITTNISTNALAISAVNLASIGFTAVRKFVSLYM